MHKNVNYFSLLLLQSFYALKELVYIVYILLASLTLVKFFTQYSSSTGYTSRKISTTKFAMSITYKLQYKNYYSETFYLQFLPGHYNISHGLSCGTCLVNIETAIF